MNEISNTERLLWYKMALVTLKQAVQQVGNGEGKDPKRVIQELHGDDYDAWIPRLDEDVPFNYKLWEYAQELSTYDDDYRADLSSPMLRYWHHYEAHVRKWPRTILGGLSDEPPNVHRAEGQLNSTYIKVNEKKRQRLEKLRLECETPGRYKKWYEELLAVIYEDQPDGMNERPDPRDLIRRWKSKS